MSNTNPTAVPVYISEYLGPQGAIMPMAALPLPDDQVNPLVNADVVVHFTVAIPLEQLMAGDAFTTDYVRQFFADDMEICGLEFRAVGAQYEEFEQPMSGDVLLQCTCTLSKS